jgi:surface antigen
MRQDAPVTTAPRPVLALCLFLLCAGCSMFGQPAQFRQRQPLFLPAAVNQLAEGFVAARFPGLDGIDRKRAAETMVASLENGRPGQPNPWRNPDSRNSGETIPGEAAPVPGRTGCRRFTHTASVRGTAISASGVACKGQDGVWTVVS